MIAHEQRQKHQAQADALGEDRGNMSVSELRSYLGGVSKSTIHRWVRDRLLPAPIKLGPRKIVFDRAEVRQMVSNRPRTVGRKIEADQAA